MDTRRTSTAAAVALGLTLAAASRPAAAQWTRHTLPAVGANDDVLSVAITHSGDFSPLTGQAFYIAYEVQDTLAQTHTLYLQRWNGLFWTTPVTLGTSAVPILSNPSIAASPGLVTVVAHEERSGCQALVEFSYDVASGTVDSSRVLDDGDALADTNCEDVGHSHVVWSPSDSSYHACWTRKVGGALGDEVYCSRRLVSAAAWDAPTILASGNQNQDHVALALSSGGLRRVAFHDATSGVGNDAHEAKVRLFRSGFWADYTTYAQPAGVAVPQPGRQDRPYIALDSAGRMHVAWEEGPLGGQGIRYTRCLNSTANGCDANAEWEYNATDLQDGAALSAHYPHLAVGTSRTWISYQQELAGGLNEVVTLHRCLGTGNGQAWTVSDPNSDDSVDEFTEEYGTPHIAVRARGAAALTPEVGTVALRELSGTGRYEAVLYTRPEPTCN